MAGILDTLAQTIGGYFGNIAAANQAARMAPYQETLRQLLGQPGGYDMGPPDPATGAMGYAAGTGVIGRPDDPNARAALAALAGWLIGKGWLSEGTVAALTPVVIAAAPLVWGYLTNHQRSWKIWRMPHHCQLKWRRMSVGSNPSLDLWAL